MAILLGKLELEAKQRHPILQYHFLVCKDTLHQEDKVPCEFKHVTSQFYKEKSIRNVRG